VKSVDMNYGRGEANPFVQIAESNIPLMQSWALLSGLTGPEFQRELRARGKMMPIIFIFAPGGVKFNDKAIREVRWPLVAKNT
jgi:hypothetical protein